MAEIPATSAAASARPAVFGEVLFDEFPDGTAVPGGASFNVAWHLRGFGLDPLFLSRVGADERGERIRAAMADWGMDLRGLQSDPLHPTGAVRVTLGGARPTFTMDANQAYDYIDPEAAVQAMADQSVSLLYHGSLIARHSVSRTALQAVRSRYGVPAFLDVNLRPPWWTRESVAELLMGVRWVKLSDADLAALHGEGLAQHMDPAAAATALLEHYGPDMVVVTQGAAGALLVTAQGHLVTAPTPVEGLVDTVGAGDAFSAVVILGLWHAWPLPLILKRAAEVAAATTRVRGAVRPDRALYAAHLQSWAGGSGA